MICRLALLMVVVWTAALVVHTYRMLAPELEAAYAEWLSGGRSLV